MPKNILAAIDGSPPSMQALKLAARLAQNTGGTLTIATVASGQPLSTHELEELEKERGLPAAVVEPAFAISKGETYSPVLERSTAKPESDPLRLAIAKRLLTHAAFIARQAGASAVETLVDSGDPATRILDIVKSCSPDLVVIGSRGLGHRAEGLLGGVSEEIMRGAPCAVLVARPSEEEEG